MRVVNRTRGTTLITNGHIATSLFARMRGLIWRPPLRSGQGLLLTHCNAIHTFGMGYGVDVVFVDNNFRVIKAVPWVPPNRFGPIAWRASSVLEMKVGTIDRTETRNGDHL